MKIYLATDHAGFALKEEVKKHLLGQEHEIEDCGAMSFNPQDDYPDFISIAAEKVSHNPNDKAIIFGGSGQAEAMTANKFDNIRAAVFYGPVMATSSVDIAGRESQDKFEVVKLAREHNDANVLSIGARFVNREDAMHAVDLFLQTNFSNDERHKRRIEKMRMLEK